MRTTTGEKDHEMKRKLQKKKIFKQDFNHQLEFRSGMKNQVNFPGIKKLVWQNAKSDIRLQ